MKVYWHPLCAFTAVQRPLEIGGYQWWIWVESVYTATTVGLLWNLRRHIRVRIWKEQGRDNYFLLRQLWFSEGLLGLDPPLGEGANPAAFPYVNRNLCKVYVFRGQPGHSPSAFTQKYDFFKFRLQLKTDKLSNTERQKKVHREGDIRCFSVSLGNLDKKVSTSQGCKS